MQKGTGKLIGGAVVVGVSSAIGLLLVEENPAEALVIGIAGGVVGIILNITGILDLQKAGRELQSFPYD